MKNSLHLLTLLFCSLATATAEFQVAKDTQNPEDIPPSPQAAAAALEVPNGFVATLFAGDPDVRQPIAFDFDDRGRMWVVENYTYNGHGFDRDVRDRLIILEDKDGDGTFDERTVFWENGIALTAVNFGFGGIFVLNDGALMHIADANGDDIPDSEPIPLIDGFDTERSGHNIVNGLLWGPDGWLYGRHGILAPSFPGIVGTPLAERKKLSCGIWRYHPLRKEFERVVEGTTNPWGMDYNTEGEMFFTNNVIGHLWHVIPGAHYKRMYGEDTNPLVFDLIDQHANHYHWNNGGGNEWQDSRDTSGEHGKLGGGHSHCGGMIYLGDNWPDEYRGSIFMCNTHGRRVNVNTLTRSGSGYVGGRAPDMIFARNQWFKGVTIQYGPDGGVYISDWSDIGECHDHDGVHRSSGRIYKVTYGKPAPVPAFDLQKKTNTELLALQRHKNAWWDRKARRILHERQPKDLKVEGTSLRHLWTRHLTGGIAKDELLSLTQHENEAHRVWAIRLLLDSRQISPDVLARFKKMATSDSSGLVRLTLTSSLQKLPANDRWPIARALASHAEDIDDHNLPLMLWYGIESAVPENPSEAITVRGIPIVTQYITRRLMLDYETHPAPIEKLLSSAHLPSEWHSIFKGMAEATRGWQKITPPKAWAGLDLDPTTKAYCKESLNELSVLFGEGRAIGDLINLATSKSSPIEAKRDAIRILGQIDQTRAMRAIALNIGERGLEADAIRALANYNDPSIPKNLLKRYNRLPPEAQQAAIEYCVFRPESARQLIHALRNKNIPISHISAYAARQLTGLGDKEITAAVAELWGNIRNTPEDKRKLIVNLSAQLTDETLRKADLSQGRLVFSQICATCHKMYGEGGNLAPELTGSDRQNLGYLLENIVDPGAVVPVDYRMTTITLKDGRVLTGAITAHSEKTTTITLATQAIIVETAQITKTQFLKASLMPEGLLTTLSETQIRDLIAYLQNQHQIELPK